MSETLAWWVMMQVVGLAALPLCLSLFQRLPDRGYTLSKAFGLLIVGYLFWILVIIGLPNSARAIWFVLLLIAGASGLFLILRRPDIMSFVREHWWLIVTTEAVLFISFITAAYLRSYVPDFGGTEKPMDLMFLNALTRADSFPPADPWLAGESVSYYYFGYLLVSVMTRLSDTIAAVSTGIGFNLGLAMIVSLGVTGAFGLVYNLAAPREERAVQGDPGAPAKGFNSKVLVRPMIFGLAGALLLAVMGNLEGLLELFAAHNFGSAGVWDWVDVRELVAYDSARWFPDQFWFWWKATRILDGGAGIHEMPFFSFLLGDLHPHVMSIPFVLLAVSVALTLLRADEPLDLVVWLERPLWLVAFGLIIGSLAFLNTWDMPTMAFIVVLIVVLRNRLNADRWSWGLALDSIGFLIPLFLVAFLAYIPFFFGGFDSQAAGFTAYAGNGSSLFHAFLLWGPFAVLVLPYAVWRLAQDKTRPGLEAILWALTPLFLIVLLWFAWDVLANVLGVLPPTLSINEAGFERGGEADLASRIAERGWSWITVFVMGGSLGLLGLAMVREVERAGKAIHENAGHIFALAIATTAALLILGSEFIYIEDGFNSRFNTIFKLYYQAWLLLSIAGGFVLYELSRTWRLPSWRFDVSRFSASDYAVVASTLAGAIAGVILMPDALTWLFGALIGAGLFFAASGSIALWLPTAAVKSNVLTWRGIWTSVLAVVLLSAFVYPVIATFNRTNGFDLPRTLDGLERIDAAELTAIEWLNNRDGQFVIAEALGNDYSEGGRISATTGLPTLLQWPGHELQWRGDSAPQAGRTEDLQTLYTSSDINAVRSIIDKYGISYVVVGSRERSAYVNITLPEMTELFELALEGEVAIYRVRVAVDLEVKRE